MKRFIIAVILRLLFIVVAVVLFPIWLVLIPIYWVWVCVMYVVAMPIGWILCGERGLDFVREHILFFIRIEGDRFDYLHYRPNFYKEHYKFYISNNTVYYWYFDLLDTILCFIEQGYEIH